MTSSMLAGERRWASARRGGMTVLGKVPKPINLPSQKLENHGLDPNVEIVPKGSLGWGSRPSSSTSNPWGSSAISPNSDGNTVSPRHPSGRPTSGGGRSRPSTAGSDRAYEPAANQWGPNSRPSSASGVLTSNQSTLTTSRPLSAETRPGSSHLSRFAEPVFDNSMAWGPNGTADKLSIPSKGNDFSLSSGDFPTLGSEKDITAKSSEHDHESHVRPGSASGRTAHGKDRNEMSLHDTKGGTVETWTRDGPPHVEEHWQGDPHQYVNPNVPPQHFDAWRGPPMNAPGVWYRGPPPPAGPPYPPVPHGGYPMEPFPYYRPQMPPPLANQQPGPPQGAGPRGHHPRNGDFYRPQMPDAFIRPNMPMRPGFYPGPVPYEGYFGPPMGYNHNHNPNDRDNPYMGMPPGPPVYNMCPPQNPSEMGEAHYRGGGRGPVGNMYVPEQMDSAPPEEPRGPYKVLRKRENDRNADVDEGNWEDQTTVNSWTLEKNDQPRPSFYKNDRAMDTRRNEDMPSRRNNTLVENPPSRMLGNQNYPSNSKASNESWGKKSEVATNVPEVAQDIPANPKDASLIQKIEGLNAKVRASDVASGNLKEEQKNRLVNPKDNSTLTFGTISTTEDLAPPRDTNLYKDNTSKSNTAGASVATRQPHHGVRKGRPVNQDNNDGWRKKSPVLGSDSNQNVGHVSAENPETKNTGESMIDPADGQAQRARMRELARQRAIQLQKEEEERIKEQKAKALAKLEELNKRTLAGESTTQTAEGTTTTITTTGSVVEKEDVDGSQKPTGPDSEPVKHEAVSSDLETKGQPVVQVSKSSQQEPAIEGEKPESKTVSAPVSTQPRKRNNKSSKNKPKVDDVSPSLVEGDSMAKPSSEIVKQEPPPPPHVESESSKDAASQSSNQYNKGPQHSRRMPRNHPQPNNRTADRFHGNEVVWAPVRAHNKEDRGEEYSQDDVAVTQKSNLKSRRAEMERYVPKAVAKEMAQQSSTPMKSTSEDIRNTEESVPQPPVPVSSASVDDTQNKSIKSTQVSLKKNNQKPVIQSETNVSHDWDPSDGWFMPEYPPPPSEAPPAVKDEGNNKGKKPAAYNNRTQRTTVTKNHHDEVDETNQTERPTSAKENRSSSHWQPKPQGHNKGGGWSSGGQGEEHVGEEGRRERKPRGGRIHSPNNYMEDESAPFEQPQQSGFRKYGGGGQGQGQNNRGGGGGRHNNNNNNANVNRERPRQNLHYEYQPVGSNKAEAAADGSGNAGPRYKERGTGQPRRGGGGSGGGGGSFYGRQ